MFQLKAGQLRALATATRARINPETPTVAESGYNKFEVDGWYGVVAPAKTKGNRVPPLWLDHSRPTVYYAEACGSGSLSAPAVPKVSFVTRVGDLACGVGYYK